MNQIFVQCLIDNETLSMRQRLVGLIVCERALRGFFALKARFHYERGNKHYLFVLLLFFCARFNFNRSLQSKINKRDKECSFPLRAWKKHCFFVLLLFFCARFNRRSIKERKNALFHARSGNGPLDIFVCYRYFEFRS